MTAINYRRFYVQPWFFLFKKKKAHFSLLFFIFKRMLSLLTKNVFGRFMTQATTTNNMMIVRGVASKPNKTAKLKGALKVKEKPFFFFDIFININLT